MISFSLNSLGAVIAALWIYAGAVAAHELGHCLPLWLAGYRATIGVNRKGVMTYVDRKPFDFEWTLSIYTGIFFGALFLCLFQPYNIFFWLAYLIGCKSDIQRLFKIYGRWLS